MYLSNSSIIFAGPAEGALREELTNKLKMKKKTDDLKKGRQSTLHRARRKLGTETMRKTLKLKHVIH